MKSDCFDPVRFTWIGGWGETGVPKTGWDYRPSLREKIWWALRVYDQIEEAILVSRAKTSQ
jgi:hypothetical protein